jgi:hypothetical protein
MKYFLVLIFLRLTELINEILPKEERRKINELITRKPVLEMN